MEPALSIIQGGKNDEREYLPEYKIFVAIYLYTHNPLNASPPTPPLLGFTCKTNSKTCILNAFTKKRRGRRQKVNTLGHN